MRVAILCGGLGTRMREVISGKPKCLLEVAGKPFLIHLLDKVARDGCQEVVLCVGYLGEQVEDAVEKCYWPGMTVRFSYDSAKQLGTGWAIRRALSMLGDEFVVINGDTYNTYSLRKVALAFQLCGREAMMCVYQNKNAYGRSNIEQSGGLVTEFDKLLTREWWDCIDVGMTCFHSSVFEQDTGSFSLENKVRGMVRERLVACHVVPPEFPYYDIGTPEFVDEARRYLELRGAGCSS